MNLAPPTWLPADAQTPCAGKHDLFDRTDRWAHAYAAKLCATCPLKIRRACLHHAEKVEPTLHGHPTGTWGGKRFADGNGRRPAAPNERHCQECGAVFEVARGQRARKFCDEHQPRKKAA